MSVQHILSDYVNQAMAMAHYDKMDDGTFSGRFPACQGVIAFAKTLRECQDEFQSVLEDWIWLGLKLRHPIPVVGNIEA